MAKKTAILFLVYNKENCGIIELEPKPRIGGLSSTRVRKAKKTEAEPLEPLLHPNVAAYYRQMQPSTKVSTYV